MMRHEYPGGLSPLRFIVIQVLVLALVALVAVLLGQQYAAERYRAGVCEAHGGIPVAGTHDAEFCDFDGIVIRWELIAP